MSSRQFAEPQSPFAVSESDLDRLRKQLAEAEKVAESRHSTWTQKTRAEQDVKQVRRALEAAELDRARKLRHETRQERVTQHATSVTATQRAVAEGRYLAPVSPWARNLLPEKASAPAPASKPVGSNDAARVCLIQMFKADGKPIPAWLAA